ncbi:hypothetical protein [Oceanisphaera avium]|uniref:Flagellar protein FliT n=1 Tax=Oceanisphaera avium TaxID=1903694 RepID=A0A1Y0CWQ5_9GAMM|nr:hypothetical protein [Oceanisphaera avium]ART79742.1 hypothetical protein CBP12_05905 [Oceanisphaera avium]
MSFLAQLIELDARLFAELAKDDEFDQDYFEEQLIVRADLLKNVISDGNISASESSELITRSRRLKEAAEQLQQRLGEQLKQMNKGRRSVQAYQTVKRN